MFNICRLNLDSKQVVKSGILHSPSWLSLFKFIAENVVSFFTDVDGSVLIMSIRRKTFSKPSPESFCWIDVHVCVPGASQNLPEHSSFIWQHIFNYLTLVELRVHLPFINKHFQQQLPFIEYIPRFNWREAFEVCNWKCHLFDTKLWKTMLVYCLHKSKYLHKWLNSKIIKKKSF